MSTISPQSIHITYAMVDEHGEVIGITNSPYRYVECDPHISANEWFYDQLLGELVPREHLDVTAEVHGMTVTLTGLPAGINIMTNSYLLVSDEEPTVITYSVPGKYRIMFSENPRYRDLQLEVTVGHP